MSKDYHEDEKNKNTLQLRELLKELPPFLSEFFRGITETTTSNTRRVYIYDLRIFFIFLVQNCNKFSTKTLTTFEIEDLSLVTVEDLESFMEYLTYYTKKTEKGTMSYTNKERGKMQKLAAIKTLFHYFYRKQKILANPSELVDMPKIREKNIIRLEVNEVAKLLDEVDSGANLTKSQRDFHLHTRSRDVAILYLLLGTGIRVSECVGINVEHVDFDLNGIKITRKGGNETIIYFGEEVSEVLEAYLVSRQNFTPVEGHQNALFLSLQNKRLGVRAIQNLVKKYGNLASSLKNISPHKLRSTYGTNLYRETGDIYLVADVLGHKDVNTTKKHYAQIDDARRKSAAKFIKLKKD